LSSHQKQQLFEQGWVVIPQVVPAEMVRAARNAINSTIENYLDSIQTRTHELKTDERLTNLLMKTDAFSLIESALGKGKVVPSTNVQCALRFPDDDVPNFKPKPHIDSFHPSVDGNPGSIKPFIAIAGFFLNDIEQDNAGNFTVWPGTHRQFAKYFEKHGADPELKLGIPPVDLPEPVQIKAKAGDMILAHYQLAHTATINLTQAIRYAVYIRMHHADRPKDSLDVLIDIWKYWYGMSEFKK
ncbi:MAG: phytanoyl-CoA dioxygenase family protein, partial [Pseudobdellovibrionaceae bacterium]